MNLKAGVLAIVLMLFSLSSHAANMVAVDPNGNRITLSETKCVISPWTTEWRNATFVYQGKTYAACWRIQGNLVIILDSGGDITPVPITNFGPETTV
jgi:hypothetical protein